MFEAKKYDRLKTENGDLSELIINLPKGAPPSSKNALIKLLKRKFSAYKTEKGEVFRLFALCEEYPLELNLGEIMEMLVECKASLGDGVDAICFSVNGVEYSV